MRAVNRRFNRAELHVLIVHVALLIPCMCAWINGMSAVLILAMVNPSNRELGTSLPGCPTGTQLPQTRAQPVELLWPIRQHPGTTSGRLRGNARACAVVGVHWRMGRRRAAEGGRPTN